MFLFSHIFKYWHVFFQLLIKIMQVLLKKYLCVSHFYARLYDRWFVWYMLIFFTKREHFAPCGLSGTVTNTHAITMHIQNSMDTFWLLNESLYNMTNNHFCWKNQNDKMVKRYFHNKAIVCVWSRVNMKLVKICHR